MPIGMLKMKLEAVQRFVRESHTRKEDADDEGPSAAPIYALLALAKVDGERKGGGNDGARTFS